MVTAARKRQWPVVIAALVVRHERVYCRGCAREVNAFWVRRGPSEMQRIRDHSNAFGRLCIGSFSHWLNSDSPKAVRA